LIRRPDGLTLLEKGIAILLLTLRACVTHKKGKNLPLSVNCSTCFGWYLHPSSVAHTTVSTLSMINGLGPSALNGNGGSAPRPGRLYPRERPGTHCTAGWVGPRAGLNGREISSPPGFDPGPFSPYSAATATELPGPRLQI